MTMDDTKRIPEKDFAKLRLQRDEACGLLLDLMLEWKHTSIFGSWIEWEKWDKDFWIRVEATIAQRDR